MSEGEKSTAPIGQPLAVDYAAASTSRVEPGFVAKPPGAPVYHGFQILSGVTADGFTFGKITDFETAPCDYGDAFVIAPDDSRAGLIWEVSDKPHFREVCPLEPERWGVWGVTFAYAMESHDYVRKNLESILPELKKAMERMASKVPEDVNAGQMSDN